MNTEQLHLFMEVAQLANISKASEKCNISQPAASIKLKNLEEDLGVKLFERTGGRFQLTNAGRIFKEKAEKILELEDELKQEIDEYFKPRDRLLNFGATTGPGNYVLPKVISDFHRDHPEIYIKMSVGSKDLILKDVINGMLDFAVVGSYGMTKIKYMPIYRDRIILCAAGSTPQPESVDIADLTDIGLYMEQKNSSSRAVLEQWLKKNGIRIHDLKCIGEVGLPDALKKIVRLGSGMAFLPETLITAELDIRELREVPVRNAEPLYRNLYLAVAKDHKQTGNERIFIHDYLKKL